MGMQSLQVYHQVKFTYQQHKRLSTVALKYQREGLTVTFSKPTGQLQNADGLLS